MKKEYLPSTASNVEFKMLAIDPNDSIVPGLASSVNATFVTQKEFLRQKKKLMLSSPVIFRGLSRKIVDKCYNQKRDYYYIDTGYIGNLVKHKYWHRIVKNGLQHSQPNLNLPDDRFNQLLKRANYDYLKFNGWQPEGKNILLVSPSEKPCKFYGINRDEWIKETIARLKNYTDRDIIVRNKPRRQERVGGNSIYTQFIEDDIYAVVTFNSIAATEAIGFGIPAFSTAPNVADLLCHKDLSKIEDPLYRDSEVIEKWQHWLAYCQYTYEEMKSGEAFDIIKEYRIE